MYDHWLEDEDEETQGKIIEINKDTGKCKDLMYKHFVHHVETRMTNTILGILGISI